jgi:hypothetical protein
VNLLGLYHSFKTRVPGFDRVTGLVFFKKSKRRRFSKKKKVNGFVIGSCRVNLRRVSRVTPGFSFPCFFFNPARFQPRVGRVLDPVIGPGRPGFKTIDYIDGLSN